MESRDWSSDVCSSDLFPSHDTRRLFTLHPNKKLEPINYYLYKTIMLCYNTNIITSNQTNKEPKLNTCNSPTHNLEQLHGSPRNPKITYVQHLLHLYSLPFALLLNNITMANKSPIDLPTVTIQTQTIKKNENNLHTPTTPIVTGKQIGRAHV